MFKVFKRILKDLEELERDSIEGISVCIVDDDDPFELHGNVKIMDGIYKDMIIHVVIHLPDDYPTTGPAMNIAPGLNFDHRFHEHILDDSRNGHTICNDMLTNFDSWFEHVNSTFKGKKEKVASGWSPGCTLKVVMMQMSVFFSDPDFDPPPKKLIDDFRIELSKFKCKSCEHTTLKPFPPIDVVAKIDSLESDLKDMKISNEKSVLASKLSCGVHKENIFDSNIVIGYPIKVEKSKFGKMYFTPHIEILSKKAYEDAVKSNKLVSVMGKEYDNWLPCYINSDYSSRSNFSANLVESIEKITNKKFEPVVALNTVILMTNHIAVNIFNGELFQSDSLIEGLCQFLQIINYIIVHYNMREHLNKFINDTLKGGLKAINKEKVPDIGVFLMNVFLSDVGYDKVRPLVVKEYLSRQVFWMIKANVNMKEKNIDNILEKRFKASKVSNCLYVFWLRLAKKFFNKEMFLSLESNYGFPSETVIADFKSDITSIKNNLIDYKTFVGMAGLNDIVKSPEGMKILLVEAEATSISQGYTK